MVGGLRANQHVLAVAFHLSPDRDNRLLRKTPEVADCAITLNLSECSAVLLHVSSG
jgi:hypothetical protein